MSDVKTMEKLDKLDKLLRQFPKGIRAVELAQKLNVCRSTVYDYLNSLQLKGLAYNKNGLWYPSTEEKPSEKQRFKSLSKEERAYLERRAEFYEDAEWLAETFSSLKPLKDFADISRKVRKELGLE